MVELAGNTLVRRYNGEDVIKAVTQAAAVQQETNCQHAELSDQVGAVAEAQQAD